MPKRHLLRRLKDRFTYWFEHPRHTWYPRFISWSETHRVIGLLATTAALSLFVFLSLSIPTGGHNPDTGGYRPFVPPIPAAIIATASGPLLVALLWATRKKR